MYYIVIYKLHKCKSPTIKQKARACATIQKLVFLFAGLQKKINETENNADRFFFSRRRTMSGFVEIIEIVLQHIHEDHTKKN